MKTAKPTTGSVVILIVMFLSLLSLIPVGMQMLTVSRRATQSQLNQSAQADYVARAGLVEATSWFRRQTVQPVRANVNPTLYPWADAAFKPLTNADPTLSDTIDESLGLVKEFDLSESNSLWGRFEVLRQQNPGSNPHNPHAVHDITDKRINGGVAGEGLAWYIESRGYVYRKRDSSKAFNEAPNEVVATARVATEIRRMALTLPANAAVLINDRSQATIQTNGKVVGGSNIGLAYYTGGSGPSVSGTGAQVAGTPNTQDIDGAGSNGSLSLLSIFGLTESELKLVADYTINSLSELGSAYPTMAVVFHNGNATFDATHKLRGGGVLYVKGNLTITTDANTLFSGVIYVTGNVNITGPAYFSGTVITEGSFTINGGGDVAEIDYDEAILNSVRQQVAQYRENKSMYYVFSGGN